MTEKKKASSLDDVENMFQDHPGVDAQMRIIDQMKAAEPALIGKLDQQGVVIYTPDELHYVNQRFARMLGYDHETFLDAGINDFKKLIFPDDRERIEAYTRDRGTGLRAPDVYEFRMVHKLGLIVWIEAHQSVIEYKGLPAFLDVYIDITARKQTEAALRASEIRSRKILESIPDPIFLMTLDGTFTGFHPAPGFEPLVPAEEFLGRNIRFFMPPDIVEKFHKAMEDVVSTGHSQKFEYQLLNDNKLESYEARCSLLSEDECLILLRNITEQVSMADAREEVIEGLDSFAHTVAHDIKSPLQIIYGYSTILAEEMDALTPDEISTSVRSILQYTDKVNKIVDEILLLSHIRQYEEIDSEPIHMAILLEDVFKRLAIDIEQSSAEMTIPGEWPEAMGYGPWVEEVWYNYVSNGIKYGGTPPKLVFGAEPLPDGMIRFWVKDNGPGISSADQADLFVPFMRLDAMRAKGQGLGLSIVGRIIRRMGGEVAVDSAIGKGSTFSFTLPAMLSAE